MKVRLSVLREHISFLLAENRIDDAREKFPEIEDEEWAQLVANQPAGSNNKYLMWAAFQVDDGFSVEVVVQTLRLFDGSVHRLKQKDINQYKDVGAVEKAIDELPTKKTKSQEAKQAKADTDVIYNDENFLVVRPHTTEASCKYGINTRWCIAATASKNYFASYSESNNKFYFVIDKKQLESKAPSSKFALAIIHTGGGEGTDRIQVYDASDRQVNMNVVANHVGDKWPEIWQKIQAHVKSNPSTREVEEAQKAVDEHVKALLAGEKVSETALNKIAHDAELTTPIVKAIIKHFEGYDGPRGSGDRRMNIMSSLSDRSNTLEPVAATAVMKWIASARPAEGGYWSGNYYLENMMRNARLTPDGFRDLAETNDETILSNIYINPATPDDLKQKIAGVVTKFKSEESARKIYLELMKSGTITAEQMQKAMEVPHNGYNNVVHTVLQKPDDYGSLSSEMLRYIPIKSADDFKKLLQFPNLPGDYAGQVLARLMQGGNIEKYDLYQILKTVPLGNDEVEQLWADNKDQAARTSMLQNPAIGPGNASKFAKSKNSAYRFAVAHNTALPAEALTLLSNDESVSTRAAVAANPKAPAEVLTKLAKDEGTAVRAGVAGNASTPRNILDALKRDSDEFIRKVARKTLKSMTTTEELVRLLAGMRGLIKEELSDDETPDIMNPSWRDMPTRGLRPEDFIAVFLLQNNGAATREEIADAYQDWQGIGGSKELWKTNKYSDKILRGSTAGGKGWYWSPPGINKGALFRLTPAGASAAMAILDKFKDYGKSPQSQATSATARPGKAYYVPQDQVGQDITGYENGDIEIEEIAVDFQGNPVKIKGKYQRLSPTRSRSQRRRQQSTKVYKYTPKNGGEVKVVKEFPKINIPRGSEVTFIRNMHSLEPGNTYNRTNNQAIVKYNGKMVVIPFPLNTMQHGGAPSKVEKEKAPPMRKSPPPAELTGNAPLPTAAAARTVGPKVSYKIYGKKAGKPAHTRLRGQAYGAPTDTQFAPGEQASLQATDDGKLKVKKVGGDHEQTWDPVEG